MEDINLSKEDDSLGEIGIDQPEFNITQQSDLNNILDSLNNKENG